MKIQKLLKIKKEDDWSPEELEVLAKNQIIFDENKENSLHEIHVPTKANDPDNTGAEVTILKQVNAGVVRYSVVLTRADGHTHEVFGGFDLAENARRAYKLFNS